MKQVNYSNFKQGDIVIIDFKFSDFQGTKVRPAIVITPENYNLNTSDIIVLKITSADKHTPHSIPLTQNDLYEGTLLKESNILVDFPLVVEKKLVQKKIGNAKKEILAKIKTKITELYEI